MPNESYSCTRLDSLTVVGSFRSRPYLAPSCRRAPSPPPRKTIADLTTPTILLGVQVTRDLLDAGFDCWICLIRGD